MAVAVGGVTSVAETCIVVEACGVDLAIRQRWLERRHDLPCPSCVYGLSKVVYTVGQVVNQKVPLIGLAVKPYERLSVK